jgi:orotate phosphoribosyltransferase
MPVAILEDVVTTGGSALKAIARVREHGLKVGVILGIVDREEGGREVLEKEAPLVTLFRRSDFL